MPRSMQFILICALVSIAAACGDSTEESNNGSNIATNNGSSPNSDQNSTTNNGTTNNGTTNNGTTNNGTTNNGTTNNGNNSLECALPASFADTGVYDNEVRVTTDDDLEAAIRAATAGTRITLAAGIHSGGIFADGVTGTAQNPVAIVGEDGAVIEGGTTNIQLSNPSYVVIENIVFRGASANGLNIDDGADYSTPANNVVLRNIVVEDVGNGGNQDCVKLSGLDDFLIENIEVTRCSGQGIDMVGCHDGVITGNSLHDTAAGVQAKGGTADVLVHGNTFERVQGRGVNAGGSTGLDFFRPIDAPFEGARIDVVSNVFVDVGEASGAPIAYVGCDACTFVNNTVIRPLTWVARILQESTDDRFVPSRNGVFANNIIVFDSEVLRRILNIGGNTAPETFTFRNNLWWDTSDPNFTGPDLGSVPAEIDGAVADPQLDENYQIDSNSPAAGIGSSAPNLPDYGGVCFGDPPSAGALEVR